jgi:hypothetical protein
LAMRSRRISGVHPTASSAEDRTPGQWYAELPLMMMGLSVKRRGRRCDDAEGECLEW